MQVNEAEEVGCVPKRQLAKIAELGNSPLSGEH
jgi:hypothetical protein